MLSRFHAFALSHEVNQVQEVVESNVDTASRRFEEEM